jgi:hypothetical protein
MMKQARTQSTVLIAPVLLALLLFLPACSMAPYRYEPLDRFEVEQRAVTKEQGVFTVRTSVPSVQEAEKLFGIPLYDRGIQPVWLEITNHNDERARLVLASIDRDYFSPLEVAYMHKKRFSKQGWMDMENYLFANALPRHIGAKETVSGFIFTNASTGTKAFNVDLLYTGEERGFEQFTFFIEVPGFVPDHKSVDFQNLYAAEDVRDVDNDGLRSLIREIPCCTTNRDGTALGRPLQLFLVADGRDLLRALLRAGWNETSYERDEKYLSGADHLFSRPPDAIFRKRRDKSTERAELGLWVAPVRVDGKPLWVAQFKHAIGRRYAIGELFLGVTLDPDTTDGRNYVLQDLWYAQALKHWAWSASGRKVSQDTPELDFHGNPWFSVDPYRSVIWISDRPVAMAAATIIEWQRPTPVRGGQP